MVPIDGYKPGAKVETTTGADVGCGANDGPGASVGREALNQSLNNWFINAYQLAVE